MNMHVFSVLTGFELRITVQLFKLKSKINKVRKPIKATKSFDRNQLLKHFQGSATIHTIGENSKLIS